MSLDDRDMIAAVIREYFGRKAAAALSPSATTKRAYASYESSPGGTFNTIEMNNSRPLCRTEEIKTFLKVSALSNSNSDDRYEDHNQLICT